MIKVLWCIFQQYYGQFTILLVNGSSKARLFRRLSNHVFVVRNIGTTKSKRVIFLIKMLKI